MKGHFVKHTEESKKKISEAHKGIKYPNRKSPPSFSVIHRGNLSEALIGNKNGLGKKHTEESKIKIGLALKGKKRNNPFGEKAYNWQGGKSFEPYSIDWRETLRRSIRERDNYICQICSQYGNNVHHKNYDKLNCNPNNLVTLCVKCNSKVNGNRDYWINYFLNKI